MSARQVRTAAKYYTCAKTHAHDRLIAPGTRYVRATVFLSGLKPHQVALCLPCGSEEEG
jgi:hypothetical protein